MRAKKKEENSKQADELLPIQPLVYEFALWFHIKYVKFPQSYKYILGQQIADDLVQLMASITEARYTRKKALILRKTQILLEKIRWRFRLAKDLHCVSIGDFEIGVRQLVEIGKMLGGWEKFTKTQLEDSESSIETQNE